MTGYEILDRVEHNFAKQLRSARKYLDNYDDAYKETHEWMRQFAIGEGVDLAAGNFPTGPDMTCVDSSPRLGNMAVGYQCDVTSLHNFDNGSLDFVLCNYIDAIHSTIEALHEWSRVLRSGGVIALIMSNVDDPSYETHRGPLANNSRVVLFTPIIIRRFLERTGFTDIKVEEYKNQIRANAKKP